MNRLAILLAACACGCGTGEPADGPRPHIVLITADTLRADHLSCYGYARETSPRIDRFAATATRYEQAITVVPKTCPSFATMMTGLHPDEHGVRHNRVRLPDGVPRIAEILAARGYGTAAFVGNPVLRREVGLDLGFETYEVFPDEDATASVTQAFVEFSERPWDRPTFVWVHFIDPHGPYTPPAELEELFRGDALDGDAQRVPLVSGTAQGPAKNKVLGAIPLYQQHEGEDRAADYVRRYDAEIRSMDAAFGQVIDALRGSGSLDNSAVLFLSDHGESLGEHDYWFEHGWFAYDATLHVPLLFKEPGQSAARVVGEQVSTLDIFPTLLELAGLVSVERAGPLERLGASLVGGSPPAGRAVLVQNSAAYPRDIVGVRHGGQKYLEDRDGSHRELYDLAVDPGEAQNLAPVRAAAVDDARVLLRGQVEGLLPPDQRAGTSAANLELDEQMRRLGYE